MRLLFYFLLLSSGALAQGVGAPAPDFFLKDGKGQTVTLDEFTGRPLLLNFWATWCPPCQEELPLFQSVAEQTPELQILLINAGEGLEPVVQYLETNTLNLRTAVNPTAGRSTTTEDTLEVAKRYRVRGMPTTFFISAEGVIESAYVGEIPTAVLTERLAQLGVQWRP